MTGERFGSQPSEDNPRELFDAYRLRDWMRTACDQDGFTHCCETAEEEGLSYEALKALLDVLEAAEGFIEARWLGSRETLEKAVQRFALTPSPDPEGEQR